MTREKAEQLLKNDVKEAENAINSSVKVNISQGQFDALVSLIYNWGAYNFKISNGLRKLNAGDYNGAADEFFSNVRGVVNIDSEFSNGLYRRRQAELALWQS
jgi:GH24 family phage-related lysozyme (muramidase)